MTRVHEWLRNHRKNFIEQVICKLIKRFGLLLVEAQVVRIMVKIPKLASSLSAESRSVYFICLLDKAEEKKLFET
jgi:putative transposase